MQVTKNIHALRINFQVPLAPGKAVDRFVYVYLLYGDRTWLIDTGVAGSESLIFNYLEKTGREPRDIAGIILTHSHPDHIGAAATIKAETGCIVAAHGAEKNWIEDVDLQARERPVPGFRTLVKGSVTVDCVLGEGDSLRPGDGLLLETVHTPGHSRGSISLLVREQGILFSGDAVPVSGEMPVYEDATAVSASIGKLKSLEALTLLLSSWDVPRRGAEVYNAFENGLQYVNRIHNAVTKTGGLDSDEPMTFCGRVLRELGMPATMANPLVAKSFYAHLSK